MSPASRAKARSARRPAAAAVIWPEAHDRLLSDPSFGPLVRRVGPVRFPPSTHDTFSFLVRSITYQQLAGKAAATIHGRLVDALGGTVNARRVLEVSEDALRGAGLSRAKLTSIQDLATRVAEKKLRLDDLNDTPDEAVVQRLTQVRGIGRWTAEMALLFHLRRPDVWPVGDLGVRAGLGRVLGWDEPPRPNEMELVGVGYRPWRSAVAWYCWRALDQAPTQAG
jgi:3-methyladenine DNA glycosylase/8-oxoguanine DNA glycosylase